MSCTMGDAICFQAQRPVPFPLAWRWQQQLQGRLLAAPEGPDAVLLLEHAAAPMEIRATAARRGRRMGFLLATGEVDAAGA